MNTCTLYRVVYCSCTNAKPLWRFCNTSPRKGADIGLWNQESTDVGEPPPPISLLGGLLLSTGVVCSRFDLFGIRGVLAR